MRGDTVLRTNRTFWNTQFICRAALLGFALCATAACLSTPQQKQSPKAIFIIVDGIPADTLERVATPGFDSIAGDGGYGRAWVGGEKGGPSESPTVSAVGYNNLLTGTWANKHNVYDNDVDAPNYAYWDIFRIAKNHNPELQTAVFSTWLDNRTKLIGDGLPAAGGPKLDYFFDGFELDTERFPHDDQEKYIAAIDELVASEAARYVETNGPDLSWVYLEYTDSVAHLYGDGPEMDAAVQWTDGIVADIWRAVQKRQQRFQEDWLIVVTTDHGRDPVDGKDHGDQSARERTTWIVTNSKRLNRRFHEQPAIVDILPSIATHMGLVIPAPVRANLDGQSFID